ncbi:PIR Superfamily Protein [Plasmodium ovale wallikeri]|uniref:PIR Superfamily Protein n=1 Tax=Plasmodium ovale wallikeri TaxID=864142 RepID=A0A1A9AJT0_PLAOA|nr:PIR Superfamily Protein [Plasmodium ovale wallikeri]SBT56872.1 PIR Superfamily Protein [Plasmodium ovale wallikeri]
MGKINEGELPSNRYRNDILKSLKINELENICKSHNVGDECIERIRALRSELYMKYHAIRSQCYNESNDPKCCREVNYCIDNIISIIQSSKYNDSDKKDYIDMVEGDWKSIFEKSHQYVCTRERDAYSIYKRCILSQLYDFNDDKEYLEHKAIESPDIYQLYDEYLNEKWSKILKYEKANNEDINITIDRTPVKQKVKCNNLPLKHHMLKSIITNKVENIKLTVSSESISHLQLDTYSEAERGVSRVSHSTGSEETDPLIEIKQADETNSASTRILVTAIPMLLGSFFFLLMLYKFSPLGSLVKNRVKKGGKIQKTLDYEKTELVEPEDNQYYIGYDTSSY